MLGYPYTYGDYSSGEEAMQRRVDFFDRVADKSLLLAVFCSVLIPTTVFAVNLPADTGLADVPGVGPALNTVVFVSIAGVCKCALPRVKTRILLLGITSICYSALCSKDKPLIIACSSIATYAATKLGE